MAHDHQGVIRERCAVQARRVHGVGQDADVRLLAVQGLEDLARPHLLEVDVDLGV